MAAIATLFAVATLPVLFRQYLGRTGAEIPIFMRGVEAFLQGRLYVDHVFEYPPYALIWFLAPYAWAPDDVQSFRLAFGLEICAACHPFFTGRQKLIDTEGRVERFNKKFGVQTSEQRKTAEKAAKATKAAAAKKTAKPAKAATA